MKKEITQRNGTIANHLIKNKDTLWACGDNVRAMRQAALKLLDDPCLTDKEAVAQAKRIFTTAKDSLFISCLMTYMTGQKVSF